MKCAPLSLIGEYDAMAVCQGLKGSLVSTDEATLTATVSSDSDLISIADTKKKTKKPKKSAVKEENQMSSWDIPAISLPNGCNSLPVELIPLLERFTKIYLWLDNDKSG